MKIRLSEPANPRYIYVNPNSNTVHLLVPVISGEDIGLDNTSKTGTATQQFFGKQANSAYLQNSALHELLNFKKTLEEDILILPENNEKELKTDRLKQVEILINTLSRMKYHPSLNTLGGGLPNYPEPIKALLRETNSNLHAILLRPSSQAQMLRGQNHVFSLDRNSFSNTFYHCLQALTLTKIHSSFQLESSFNGLIEIKNEDLRKEKLSIMVQFLVAEINVFARVKKITQTNFGTVLDGDKKTAEELVTRVKEALTTGKSVEEMVCKFISDNSIKFKLTESLNPENVKTIFERFNKHYQIIKNSPQMDEFMILNQENAAEGRFFSYQNAICFDFTDLVRKKPFIDWYRSEYGWAQKEISSLPGLIPSRDKNAVGFYEIDFEKLKSNILKGIEENKIAEVRKILLVNESEEEVFKLLGRTFFKSFDKNDKAQELLNEVRRAISDPKIFVDYNKVVKNIEASILLTPDLARKLYVAVAATLELTPERILAYSTPDAIKSLLTDLGLKNFSVIAASNGNMIIDASKPIINKINDYLEPYTNAIHLTQSMGASLYKQIERSYGKDSSQYNEMIKLNNLDNKPLKLLKALSLLHLDIHPKNISLPENDIGTQGYIIRNLSTDAIHTIEEIHDFQTNRFLLTSKAEQALYDCINELDSSDQEIFKQISNLNNQERPDKLEASLMHLGINYRRVERNEQKINEFVLFLPLAEQAKIKFIANQKLDQEEHILVRRFKPTLHMSRKTTKGPMMQNPISSNQDQMNEQNSRKVPVLDLHNLGIPKAPTDPSFNYLGRSDFTAKSKTTTKMPISNLSSELTTGKSTVLTSIPSITITSAPSLNRDFATGTSTTSTTSTTSLNLNTTKADGPRFSLNLKSVLSPLTVPTEPSPFYISVHKVHGFSSLYRTHPKWIALSETQLNCPYPILAAFKKLLRGTHVLGASYINPYTQEDERFPLSEEELTPRHLQILARLEAKNVDGIMKINHYQGLLTPYQIATLRALVKATTVAGITFAEYVGGFNGVKREILNPSHKIIVIDQAGFQWQGDKRNTGGLFFYPLKENSLGSDYLHWQNDTYEALYNVPRPKPSTHTIFVIWEKTQGHLDLKSYALGVQLEFAQALDAAVAQGEFLNENERINFAYLSASSFISGLKLSDVDRTRLYNARLLGILTALTRIEELVQKQGILVLGKIGRIELPYSETEGCSNLLTQIQQKVFDLGLEWGGARPLSVLYPRKGWINAFNNCGNSHAMPSNEGNCANVDSEIACDAYVDHLNACFNSEMEIRMTPAFSQVQNKKRIDIASSQTNSTRFFVPERPYKFHPRENANAKLLALSYDDFDFEQDKNPSLRFAACPRNPEIYASQVRSGLGEQAAERRQLSNSQDLDEVSDSGCCDLPWAQIGEGIGIIFLLLIPVVGWLLLALIYGGDLLDEVNEDNASLVI